MEATMSATPSLDHLVSASGRTKAISPEKKTKKENETKSKKRKKSPELNGALKRFKGKFSANYHKMANFSRLSSNTYLSSSEFEEDLEENVCETMSSDFLHQTKNSGDLDIEHPWNDAKPQTEEALFLCSGSAHYSTFKTWISNDKVDVQKLLSDRPSFLLEMKKKYLPCSELYKKERKKKQSDAPSTQEPFNASAFEKKSAIQSTQHKLLLSDDCLDIALPDKGDENNNKSIQFKDVLNRYDRHVFIPSYSRANCALLDWSNAGVNLESTLQILVVRPSEFNEYREWHGGRFPILCLPREETSLGYAQHWIQKIATHLGLLHIWMIDDNVQCFYEVKPSSKSDGEGAGQGVHQSDGTMKPKAITFKGSCERKFEAVFSEIEKHVKNVPNLVAISPAVFRDGKVDRKAGPFIPSPPRAVVFLDIEHINQKRVSYRPQLTSFADILFGAECENEGLKVLVWNRIHLYSKQLENTGAHSPSKADCVEIEETMSAIPSLDHLASASGRTKAISPELKDALKSVDHVEGFGIGDEKLVIHVLEGHEEEARNCIDKILKEHPFNGEHLVRTFYKSDYLEFHSRKTVGGHRLDESCFGTIGCFLQSKGVEDQEIKRYAVTCYHVGMPANLAKYGLLDTKLPADICLIPVENLPQPYEFEQDKCIQFEFNNPSDLTGREVVKIGAASDLTRGKIVLTEYARKVGAEHFENMIVVENLVDYNQPFSIGGDSGSLVLADGNGEGAPEVVSMVFGGGKLGKKHRTFTFPFWKAIKELKKKYNINDNFEIVLSKRPESKDESQSDPDEQAKEGSSDQDCVEKEETISPVPSYNQASASGRTKTISPELKDALTSVDYVKAFGIGEEKLVIYVLEGHEKEATNRIDQILKEHPFNGEHLVRTFYKTDHFKFHSGKTVGGHRLDIHSLGTIGCFLQSKGVENQEIRRYAVTCHHVAELGKMQEFDLLDRQLPADIALIPVEKLSQEYQFKQGRCIQLEVNNPSDLNKDEVVKFGAATKLTRGKIVHRSFKIKVDGEIFDNVIVVENSDDYNQPFSEEGDSGSLVTLAAGNDEETPEVVSMLFGGGELGKRKRSVTFAFGKAINKLKEKYNIEDDFEIVLSKPPGSWPCVVL